MAKKISYVLVSLLLLLSILSPVTAFADDTTSTFKPRLTAPSSSSPYYSSKLNVYFQTGSPMPNCVAYAYGRLYEINGKAPLINHGSAGEWYGINKSNGYYKYGQTPKVGAVACWSSHVAIVEKVYKDGAVLVSESHYGGGYFDTRKYDDVHYHFGQTFYGYIYAYSGNNTAKRASTRQYKQTKLNTPDSDKQFDVLMISNKTKINKKQAVIDNLL